MIFISKTHPYGEYSITTVSAKAFSRTRSEYYYKQPHLITLFPTKKKTTLGIYDLCHSDRNEDRTSNWSFKDYHSQSLKQPIWHLMTLC